MIYVFAFFGEFGYELLNWQGTIRKFSSQIQPEDKIVCCSRANFYPVYEMANEYIDISEVPLFKNSVANCYYAVNPEDLDILSEANKELDLELKKDIKELVFLELKKKGYDLSAEIKFIFSSEGIKLNNLIWGAYKSFIAKNPKYANIYNYLDLDNNTYKKILPDFSIRELVEKKLGFSLDEKFILCQTGNREIVIRSKDLIDKEFLIEKLSKEVKVVLLNFKTGRNLDSYSRFNQIKNTFEYDCSTFTEQACLVHFAQECIFFSEGDFR